jgi:hypothetical protein
VAAAVPAGGDTVMLSLTRPVTGSGTGAFVVTVDAVPAADAGYTSAGEVVTVVSSTPVLAGQVVTLGYEPGTLASDPTGRTVDAVTAFAVTNNSEVQP